MEGFDPIGKLFTSFANGFFIFNLANLVLGAFDIITVIETFTKLAATQAL